MKKLLAGLGFAAIALFSGSSAADESVVTTIPETIIYGRRPPRPLVVVDIARPTAAHEAGIAHESLRESLLQKSMPPALRH